MTVYYDRIVIDADPDHTVSYYIYPDGYGRQPLTLENVKKALAGYGVEDFAQPSDIYNKIAASDGEVTYVAKAYDLYVNGKKLKKRALGKNGHVYVPAIAVASALGQDLTWDGVKLTGPYGSALGINKSDVIYADGADAFMLFHCKGTLRPDYTFRLDSIQADELPQATVTIDTD